MVSGILSMLFFTLGIQTSLQIIPLKTFEEKKFCTMKGVKGKVWNKEVFSASSGRIFCKITYKLIVD